MVISIELLFIICWFMLPALLASRITRLRGVLLGTVTFWVFSVAHPFIAPQRYFLGSGSPSLLLGLLCGLVYSALCYRIANSLRKTN